MRPQTVFYARPDVLWGLGRTLLGEPRFVRRLGTSGQVGIREWLLSPLVPARA
ncbi:MAG TPA: hypothetical protein VKH82_12735 [Candidatus Binatia bacterium]|nr:hypothetical protein [Candidatus Binatia bacterium]